MNKKYRCLALWLLWALSALPVAAKTISVPVMSAEWQTKQSRTACQLTQTIPQIGVIGFYQSGGERFRFSLQERQYRMPITRASLLVEPPPWREDRLQSAEYTVFLEEVGDVDVRGRLSVYDDVAEKMLTELFNWRYPVFSYVRQGREMRVAASSVNFAPAYEKFIACRSQLFPYSRQQVSFTRLFFHQKSTAVLPDYGKRLDQIALYLNEFKQTKVALFSNTDLVGKADKKWFDKRAAQVRQFFVNKGVDAQRIVSPGNAESEGYLRIDLFGPDVLRYFYYRKGSIRLNSKEKQRLDLIAQYAKEFSKAGKIVIASHTDSKGRRAANLEVSRKRGEAIKQYLLDKGVNADLISVKAYGESRPVKSNRFPPGRAQNRRAIVSFVRF